MLCAINPQFLIQNKTRIIAVYIPKSTPFDKITDEKIIDIQEKLNNRPRKKFKFKTPNYMFNQMVAFIT